MIAVPPKPPDVICTSSQNLPFSIITKGITSMQFSDGYSITVLQIALQLFDEMSKYHGAIGKAVSSGYIGNELENVAFELFNGMYR